MLVNGRPEMVKRAKASFRSQTFPAMQRHLLIFDTGDLAMWADERNPNESYTRVALGASKGAPIGTLRNMANGLALGSWDCIAHWDSDDWSHPQRLMEQVTLLETTGVECVGYTDLLFWRTNEAHHPAGDEPTTWTGEDAWLWSEADNRKPIGTSLCYRRKAWERVPFEAMPNRSGATSEYYHWLKMVTALGVTSLPAFHGEAGQRPRMIASIHGANTQYYDPADYVEHNRGTSWRRAAEWDKICSEIMAL